MKVQSTSYIDYIARSNAFSTKKNAANVRFCASCADDKFYREAKVSQEKKRQQVQAQRILALFGAIGMGAVGTVGALVNHIFPNEAENLNPDFSSAIYGEPFEENDVADSVLGDDSEIVITTPDGKIDFEVLFESNPELKKQYENISESLDTFSEHLGEDGLSLILDKVDEIGNGKVNPIEVLKILYLESTGRIYSDKESGTILKSRAGAYGAFQVTEDTADYMNDYFGLTGTEKELNVKDPYSNLEACVYTLRFLAEKRGKELQSGKTLPTGTDLKTAVAWSYHDGAWATSISDYGESYIRKYQKLDILNEYPEIIDYLAE